MLTIMPVNNNLRNNNINFKSVYAATPSMVQDSDTETKKLYGQSLKGLGNDNNKSFIGRLVDRFFASNPSQEDYNKVRAIKSDLYNAADNNQRNLDVVA